MSVSEAAQAAAATQPLLEVEGQIISRRALSKKLVFMDIQKTAPSMPGSQAEPQDSAEQSHAFLELVIKVGVFGDIPHIQDARDKHGLGDVVRATGYMDGPHMLLVTSLTLVSRWQTVMAGKGAGGTTPSFQPTPAAITWKSIHQPGGHTSPPTSASPPTRADEPLPASSSAQSNPTAAPATATTALCKFWLNTGQCAHGDRCPLRHVEGEERVRLRKTWLEERKQSRQAVSAQEGFFVHSASSSPSTRRHRAQVLAQWLVDTWGVTALSAGSGVLDVAGGRGALSFELRVVHGVKVTLVEPRPFKLDRYQCKLIKARKKQATREAGVVTQTAAQAQLGVDLVAASQPSHGEDGETDDDGREDRTLQEPCVREVSLGSGLSLTQVCAWFDERLWQAALDHQSRQSVPDSGAHGSHAPDSGHSGAVAAGPHSASTAWSREVLEVVAQCSVVVGLHPDQATEQIIRFVSACPSKDFAIVPCCVFPRLYAHRRLRPTGAGTGIQNSGSTSRLVTAGSRGAGHATIATLSNASTAAHVSAAAAEVDGMWTEPSELMASQIRDAVVTGSGDSDAGGGTPVVLYSDLVRYLVQEGGVGTREDTLLFEGANRVVWRKANRG